MTKLTGSLIIALLAGANVYASVRVTSFNFLGARTSAAEVCGKVDNLTNPLIIVDLVSDPNYKSPANYSALTSKDGSFCVVINTVTGKVEATVRGQSEVTIAHAEQYR